MLPQLTAPCADSILRVETTGATHFVQLARLISELSNIWSNDADFRASLEVICRFGKQMLEADGAYALLAEGGQLRVVSASGRLADQLLDRSLPLRDYSHHATRVVQSGVAEIDSAGDLPGGLFQANSLLLQPVPMEDRTIGALVFARVNPHPGFGAVHQALAAVLARQASFAYRMRRRARELELIYEVSRAINSSLKLDEVLEFILEGISRILPTDNFYIAFYDEPADQIHFEIEMEDRKRLPKRSRPRRAGLTEYLLETRRPLLIDRDFIPSCDRLGIRFGGRAARCWMGAPMVLRNKAVGVIALQSYDQEGLFDQDHLSVLENLATQAAVAIENARLYQQTVASYHEVRTAQQLLLQSEKLAAVGQLISGIAHELNNPLTAVVGWTQYLLTQMQSAPVQQHLTTINEQAQRASKIVQNLLTFSRQHKPEQCPVSVQDILERTLALRAYELRVNNIAVHRNYAPELPMIAADPHQIQQVILNLILNAEQAILSRARAGRITITTEKAGGKVRITVCDDGPGIPPDLLKKIFDPFFTTKPVGQGTGLGLSISFGIIQEHNGKIWGESEPGSGARLVVELPMAGAAAALPAGEPARSAGRQAAKRVLIVDDEESVRELLLAMLEDQSLSMETAGTGEEALQKACSSTFDLIITDLKMPGLSGAQFCEKLRQVRPSAPQFIFITGDVLSSETQQFLDSTRSLCMLKPFDIGQAREVILGALAAPQAAGVAAAG